MGFRDDPSIQRYPGFRKKLNRSKRKIEHPTVTVRGAVPGYCVLHSQKDVGASPSRRSKDASSFLTANGRMSQAVSQHDWSNTPLGDISTWPDSLRTAVGICLNAQFAMAILWGPELLVLYNDAYSPILGDKHPGALGLPGAVIWSEIWPTVGPMFNTVLTKGESIRYDDLLLLMYRRGFVEECYFTFSYSPVVVKGGGIGGVFVAVLETTERVINERRLRTLSELATKVALGRDQEHAFSLIEEALAGNLYAVPFSALFLLDRRHDVATLAFCTGLHANSAMLPEHVPLHPNGASRGEHPVSRVARTSEPEFFSAEWILGSSGRCGLWPQQPASILALPLQLPGQPLVRGVFVVASNPRRPFDNAYREFFNLVLGHVATAVAHADAVEAERRRVDSLAELDRAKSRFFANASHELRTPVTLILGPIQQLLEHDADLLPQPVSERLEMVHRNAVRLQKLINAMLDFASIEAGRLLVRPEPTDIAMLTRDIASLFRSAVESAGLGFSVKCAGPIADILIDPEMWEKIVSNLIANAFKFTRQGRIDIVLECDAGALCLKVRDTGIGMPPDVLSRIFERFFRGDAAVVRSIEGTGIGLSLVQELIRLQGGDIAVNSVPGAGTTVTVQLPMRLVPTDSSFERIAPDSPQGVRRWTPAGIAAEDPQVSMVGAAHRAADPFADRIKVLIVDDNEDIVRYLERLLHETCEVISASDGASGLHAARDHRPDLILMDVMMPGMDGFELLKAIRVDPVIQTVSVIMLSARAGEEARLEALDAGADGYLAKPFSARELTALVRSQVQMVRIRRDAVARESELLRQIATVRQDLERVVEWTSDAFANLDRNLRYVSVNDTTAHLLNMPKRDLIGRVLTDVSPDEKDTDFERAIRRAIEEQIVTSVEHFHTASGHWFSVRCYPAPHGVSLFGADITERKNAEQALKLAHAQLESRVAQRTQELNEASKLLAAVFDRAPSGIAITDTAGKFIRANTAYHKLIGYTERELYAHSVESLAHPDDYPKKKALLQQLLSGTLDSFALDMRYRKANGEVIWVNNFVSTIKGEDHRLRYFVKITQNVTGRKRAEQEILTSQTKLRILYDRLQTVREEERVAIAREVHDQLGQILSAAKIDIKLLEDDIQVPGSPLSRRKISKELQSARRSLDQAIQSVRRIATELRPPELEERGLRAALEWHALDFERRTRIKCRVTGPAGVREPAGAIATALFRIFQEAMTNVLRHAKASEVWITLGRRGNTLLLRVRDNGVGISPDHAHSARSIGLKGMRERAALAGARLVVGPLGRSGRSGSSGTNGTVVTVRVPLADDGFAFSQENDLE